MSESLTYPDQIRVIEKYARGKQELVEVGVCFGGTSKILRSVMAEDGRLHLVDPFPAMLNQEWKGKKLVPSLKIARINVESVPRGTVVWYVQTSEAASKNFSGLADFVFIDGLHDYESVKLDWRCWGPKVKQGGIVLFHDVAGYCPEVQKAFQEISGSPGWDFLGIEKEIGVMKRL